VHVDTLQKHILERRIKEIKQSGRAQCRTLQWMPSRDNGYTYNNLKEMAQCGRAWRDWCLKHAIGKRPKQEDQYYEKV